MVDMEKTKRAEAALNASRAASRMRTLRRLRRLADELRAAGWTVEEPA
jgi:hypothetical protein